MSFEENRPEAPAEPDASPKESGAGALGPLLSRPDGELAARRRALDEVEARVEALDAEMAAARVEARAFEARYRAVVGARYAELERVEADIAEALVQLNPDDPTLIEKAREARVRAEESSAALGSAHEDEDEEPSPESDVLKRLYRRVAFVMHPDRCSNEWEIPYRNELMAEANRAYSTGDRGALEALLDGVEPRAGAGGVELELVLLRLARARQRLAALERECMELESTELFRLWQSVRAAAEQGRDALKELSDGLDRSIARARNRLEILHVLA
jgi:hypothetical protein